MTTCERGAPTLHSTPEPDSAAGTTARDCLFCRYHDPEISTVLVDGPAAYVRWDNFPVTPGHLNIVPKRHVESYFDLSTHENTELHVLAVQARRILADRFQPDGYTVGINEGRAAGRTIDHLHLHLHLIPRHQGDVLDPRGGIRNVLPGPSPDEWCS